MQSRGSSRKYASPSRTCESSTSRTTRTSNSRAQSAARRYSYRSHSASFERRLRLCSIGPSLRLATEPERGRELHRSDLVRGGGAQEVAPRPAPPRDRPVACAEASSRECLHDPAAGCLDAQRDPRGPCELEGSRHQPVARRGGDEAERVVERELTVGDRMAPKIVVGDRPERPGSLRLSRTRPVELVA